MRPRRAVFLLAALALVPGLLLPGPATASAPDKYTETVLGYSEPFDDCGFEADHVSDVVITTRVFYDAAGDFRQYRESLRVLKATWTNISTGRSIGMQGGQYTYVYNAGDDFGTFSGRLAVITTPGGGVIFQDAGHIRVQGQQPPWQFPFIAGHHDYWLENFSGICAYLAG